MKKLIAYRLPLALLLAGLSFAGNDETKTFRGEIADSQCALNVHSLTRSHEEMLKSKSMGGNAASCALYCIKFLGGDLVLSGEKDVYRLDEQGQILARKFVGEKVKVTGTLDKKTNTIQVEKIELGD